MSQETKKITLDAGVGVKIDPRFQKVMRDVQRGLQMGFNTKHIKEYSKEFDKVLKNSKAMGISVGKLGKVMKESYNKSLIDGAKAMKMLQAELQRTERMMERSTAAKARYARAMRYKMTRGNEGPMTAGMAAEYGSATEGFNARYDSTAAAKAEMIRDQMMLAYERQQQEKQDRRNLIASRTMQGAQIVGAVAQSANSIAQTYLGYEGRKLGYEAQAAGLGASLYNKLAGGGGFTEAAAMMASGSRIQGIASNAASAANWNAGTQMVGGAAQVVGSGALLYANPTAAMLGNSVSGIGSGVSSFGEGLAAWNGGADRGAYSSAAMSAIEQSKLKDYVFQRAISDIEQNAQGRMKQYRLFGGQSTYLRNAQAGANFLYGDQFASAGLHNQLAGEYGNTIAAGITPEAMRMERDYRINAGVAGSAMGRFTEAGTPQAAAQLEKILRRGVRLGLQDTQLKEALVSAIEGDAYGPQGRRAFGDAGIVDFMTAGMGGRSMLDFREAMGGFQALEQALTQDQGYGGALNLQRTKRVLQKHSGIIGPAVSGGPGGLNALDLVMANRLSVRDLYNPSSFAQAFRERFQSSGWDKPDWYSQGITTSDENYRKFMQDLLQQKGRTLLTTNAGNYLTPYIQQYMKDNPGSTIEDAYKAIGTDSKYNYVRKALGVAMGSEKGLSDVTGEKLATYSLLLAGGATKNMGKEEAEAFKDRFQDVEDLGTADTAVASGQLQNMVKALNEVARPENAAVFQRLSEFAQHLMEITHTANGRDPSVVIGNAAKALDKIADAAERVLSVADRHGLGVHGIMGGN